MSDLLCPRGCSGMPVSLGSAHAKRWTRLHSLRVRLKWRANLCSFFDVPSFRAFCWCGVYTSPLSAQVAPLSFYVTTITIFTTTMQDGISVHEYVSLPLYYQSHGLTCLYILVPYVPPS
ncbi:hypothetical protein DICSQDRAFT_176080 [Dichomitus squalens LYAD-421 SS1]|uniref:Uncharacterized protein n=2 Tax=Dichomitus squalens TaxID=114155 RepID=A0A4Q9MEJ2_9APHY|nr:uncharacterized protein DICSQDRAFT_176080 [Dichomitus squalens LYAD-421 SS1]EJF55325.1 hypothetical protein DICSQDRAFT_176080 [Dichomitus squalens LYAD-421 SS1]TBU24482.1 hypothetical protein BD311DRAFT_671784 [Dichomitus squalens]